MSNIDHLLLFKTNISSHADKQILQPVLDNQPSIRRWSVDLNDCDYVLRIESEVMTHREIIELIHDQGFECSELQ